jgi:MFS family permease
MGTYIGLAIFVPIYFEVVLGLSARDSGLALVPLMVGVVIGATASGRLMARVRHYKRAPLAGVSLAVMSVGAIALTQNALPFWLLLVLLFSASLGLGTVMPVATVSVQNAAPPGHLGTATAAMNFSRQLFGAIVVAVFGAIVLSGQQSGRGVTLETLANAGASPELLSTFRYVFAAATAGLVASLAFFILMEERPLRDRPAE